MTITLIIAIITGIVSIVAFRNDDIKEKLSFNPYKIIHNNEYHRIFTHALVHADWMHLIINVLVFVSFGDAVEYYFQESFGEQYKMFYIMLYVGGVLFSSFYGLLKHKDDIYYSAVGASGAVSAVLFASVLYNPTSSVYFYGIIPIPGIVFAVLYLFYSYKMKQRGGDNIAHDAHFFGAVFGFIYPILLMPNLIVRFFQQIISILN